MGLILLRLKRANEIYCFPQADEKISLNDILIVIGADADISPI